MKHTRIWAIILLGWTIQLTAQPTIINTLADSGPGSLRLAIFNSSPGDTIVMSPSLIANGSDTLHFSSAIAIPRSLTIIGAINNGDTLFFSGGHSDRLFTMLFPTGSTAEVNLIALALVNGTTIAFSGTSEFDDGGGAIIATGLKKLRIAGSYFESNKVMGSGSGGALLAKNTNVEISNCTFFHNQANDSTSTVYTSGGGAAAFQSKIKIHSTKFIENTSLWRGGGLATSYCTVSMEDALILRNISNSFNSGVNLSDADSTEINTCIFEGHIGEALTVFGLNNSSVLTIDASYFAFNSNQNYLQAHPILTSGSLIPEPPVYLFGVKINISNSTFLNNFTMYKLFGRTRAIALLESDSIRIRKCSFITNESVAINSSALNQYFSIGCQGCFINFFQILNCTFIDHVNFGITPFYFNQPGGFSSPRVRNTIFSFKDNNISNSNGNILSLGYNTFKGSPSVATPTDLTNMDSTSLALDKLGTYGGLWPVRVPKTNSPAFNSGNPNDFSPAQNGPIYGIRDRGAAERPVIINDTVSSCFGPVSWWGNTFTNPGVYRDTASNANSLDSTGVLVLTGLEATLVNNGGLLSAAANEPSTFQWINCSTGQVVGTGTTFLPAANGSYAAVATAGSCIDTTECVAYNEVSLEETRAQSVVVYPNPTSGTIRILSRRGELPTSYRISDLQGRLLGQGPLVEPTLHFQGLPLGTYLLHFTWKDGSQAVERILIAP